MSSLRLSDLPRGTLAQVCGLVASATQQSPVLHRLSELGFLPGETVQVLRRGPGGREPLAVQIGETLFALRQIEAQCVEVALV